MDPDVFDLVYEGFWDLYTLRPCIRDLSARKLQGWIQKIKLTSGPDRLATAEEKAEAEEEGEEETAKEEKPQIVFAED